MQPRLKSTKHEKSRIDGYCNEYSRCDCCMILRVSFFPHHHMVIPRKEAAYDGENDDGEA